MRQSSDHDLLIMYQSCDAYHMDDTDLHGNHDMWIAPSYQFHHLRYSKSHYSCKLHHCDVLFLRSIICQSDDINGTMIVSAMNCQGKNWIDREGIDWLWRWGSNRSWGWDWTMMVSTIHHDSVDDESIMKKKIEPIMGDIDCINHEGIDCYYYDNDAIENTCMCRSWWVAKGWNGTDRDANHGGTDCIHHNDTDWIDHDDDGERT